MHVTAVSSIRPYTSTEFEFTRWLTVDAQTSIVFRVRACNDAHLALGQIPGNFDVNTYQLVIGAASNTQHYLRDGISGTTLKVRIYSAQLTSQRAYSQHNDVIICGFSLPNDVTMYL